MRAREILKKIFTHKVLNPFNTVRYKGDFKPDSRTLHTSFKEKMQDTYQVFNGGTVGLKFKGFSELIGLYGNIFRGERVSPEDLLPLFTNIKVEEVPFKFFIRPGLFDYATLGIFRLFHGLDHFCKWVWNYDYKEAHKFDFDAPELSRSKKIGITTAKILIFIPAIAINLIHHVGNSLLRPLISGILTLAVSPLVLLSHGISQAVRWYKEKQLAESLDVISQPSGSISKLHVELTTAEISFCDMQITTKPKNNGMGPISNNDTNDLAFNANYFGSILGSPFATKLFDKSNAEQMKQHSELAEVSKSAREIIHGFKSIRPRHR